MKAEFGEKEYSNENMPYHSLGYEQSYTVKTEKAVASYSSTLAWEIPWTEEPRRLQSMGSLKVRHD